MRPILLVCALSLAAVPACSDQGPPPGLGEEIEVNRARWDVRRPASYEYTLERRCFCGIEARGPVVIRVASGAVVSRVYLDSGAAVGAPLQDGFPPAEGLFDILEDALDRGAHHIEVTWDPDTGLPIDFYIDYDMNVADEEMGYGVVALPAPL